MDSIETDHLSMPMPMRVSVVDTGRLGRAVPA